MEEFTGNQNRGRLRGWKTIKQSHKGNECYPKTKHKNLSAGSHAGRPPNQTGTEKAPTCPNANLGLWWVPGMLSCAVPAVLDPRFNPRIPKGLGVSGEEDGTQVSLRLQGI